jgi:TPR repeat protein
MIHATRCHLLPAALLLLLASGALLAQDCPSLYDQARKTRDAAVSKAAVDQCRQLAARGDLTGRYLLGLLTIDGIGTPGDAKAGLEMVRAAADAGLGAAQARLGRMLLRGEGLPADPAAAAGWFERAALNGDPLGQYELGQLRYKGLGTAPDPYEAYKWFSAAALNFERSGNVPRQKLAQRKRETVAAELTATEREQAEAWLVQQSGVIARP